MIRRVVSFGCSYMNGDELASSDDDVKPLIDGLFESQPRDHTGSVPEKVWQPWMFREYHRLIATIPEFMDRCHAYSMGGYLAGRLGATFENRSKGGYSNDAIMAELIKHRPGLDGETLVLVGLTHADRTTRLDESDGSGFIRTYNHYSATSQDRDAERYAELSLRYGDDTLTKFMHVRNHALVIAHMLRGIPHLIIDPINIYRQNGDVDGKLFTWRQTRVLEMHLKRGEEPIINREVLEAIQRDLDEVTFGYTLMHAMVDVHERGMPCRESLGHPNKLSHEAFVDGYILPHLRNNGIS